MANSWFQFREFRIEQGRSAMKVCTDSCLFAALAAQTEKSEYGAETLLSVLDAGSGTGLLSLMMAQVFRRAAIKAVEFHAGSAADCRLNFNQSVWKERLELVEADVFSLKGSAEVFDVILCNPPFFLSHLSSPDLGRNAAMHSSGEGLEKWLVLLKDLLSDGGRLWLLLSDDAGIKIRPVFRKLQLQVQREFILQKQNLRVWRRIFCLSRMPVASEESTIFQVLQEGGGLTAAANQLMADFYLPR